MSENLKTVLSTRNRFGSKAKVVLSIRKKKLARYPKPNASYGQNSDGALRSAAIGCLRGLGAELEGWRPLVCVEGSEMRTQQKTRTGYLI